MFFCGNTLVVRYVLILTALVVPVPLFAAEITTLKDSVAYALEHNRMLAISSNRVDSAEAQVDMVTGRMLPRVDVSTGFVRTNSPLGSFGAKLQQQSITNFSPAAINQPGYVNNYQSRLGLTMPIFSGGANWASRANARNQADASSLEFKFQQQQVIYQTIAAYAHARETLAEVNVLSNAVKAAKKRWQDVEAMKKRGMAIKSDAMDAHVHVLRSQVALSEAESRYEESIESLRLILGMEDNSRLNVVSEPSLLFSMEPTDQMLEKYDDRRADLLALENRLNAAENRRNQHMAAYLPRVDFVAAQEWNNGTFGLRNRNTTVGVNVKMNIFSGGEDLAKVRAATSEKVSIEYQLADKRQQAANEIRQAVRVLRMTKQRFESETVALEQTTESLRIKSLRHAQGLEKTSDLLNAQVNADASEMAHIRAKYDLTIAKAALLLAAGTLDEEVVR